MKFIPTITEPVELPPDTPRHGRSQAWPGASGRSYATKTTQKEGAMSAHLRAKAERHRERAYADIRARVESGAIPLRQGLDEMRAACARADRIALGLPLGPVERMSVTARRRAVRDMASAGTTPARIARELGLSRHYVETVLATPKKRA